VAFVVADAPFFGSGAGGFEIGHVGSVGERGKGLIRELLTLC
jgi:hypothetical protein